MKTFIKNMLATQSATRNRVMRIMQIRKAIPRLKRFSAVALLIITGSLYAGTPLLPVRIGGTITNCSSQLTASDFTGYEVTITKEDGTVVTPGASASALNTSNCFIINIPVYDAIDQPSGLNPGDKAVIHVYKDGNEIDVMYPEKGKITVGSAGSCTRVDLALANVVSFGTTFTIKASEVQYESVAEDDGGDGSKTETKTLTEFTRRPKIFGLLEDSIKNKTLKVPFKVLTKVSKNAPQEAIEVMWKGRLCLVDKKALKAGYKQGLTTKEVLAANPQYCENLAFTNEDDETGVFSLATKEDNTNILVKLDHDLVVGPPQITNVTDEDDNTITSAGASQKITIVGRFFGDSKCNVGLEYVNKKGMVRIVRCRVIDMAYTNDRGKPSPMDCDINQFGVSEITVEMPKKFPKDWDDASTSHNIVLDNRLGVATYDFKTDTETASDDGK